MTRHWYAVYTLPDREKKLASSLTKRGIKNYHPVNNIVNGNPNQKKAGKEALFSSYVFVYITEKEIEFVKKVPGVISFLHWLSRPATIQWEEIEAVRQLTASYHNIKVERSPIRANDTVRIVDEPLISFNDISASVKFQTLRVILPSIGFTLIAERDKVNDEKVLKDFEYAGFLPKKLNLFFSN